MDNNLVYMPTMRIRQQEILVLKDFDFGDKIYPLLEIVKEFDRSRKEEVQKTFEEVHLEIINQIKSERVFVDLPVYLKASGAMKNEVVAFSYEIINDIDNRCRYINKLSALNEKIIPVIS